MLIHYSIAAYELLETRMTNEEKEDVYDVFHRMGKRMELKDLPAAYSTWLADRERHMQQDLVFGKYTADLFLQYKKHLGENRYRILIEAQKLVVPSHVAVLLRFSTTQWLAPTVPLYKLSRLVKLDHLIKWLLLPHKYQAQIKSLDIAP